jgi:hypothetical protein
VRGVSGRVEQFEAKLAVFEDEHGGAGAGGGSRFAGAAPGPDFSQ